MPRRDVYIEIIAPVDGLETRLGSSMIKTTATPNVDDCSAYYGAIQKDYGTSLFTTASGAALGVPVNLILNADFGNNSTLQVFTHTAMFQYSAGSALFVNDGQTYSGTYTDFWNAAMHNDKLHFTNGVDLIQAKTAYNSTGAVMGGVATSSYKAYALVSFANHLNAYHTTEAGNECNRRVRWTIAGLLGYTGTDWSSGTANFVDLQDAEGNIITAAPLGNGAVAVYAENSIHLQEWVGGTDVYRFTKMVNGVGTPSRRGVAVKDTIHFIIGRHNIYEYRGGTEAYAIGDPIQADYVAQVNQAAIGNAFIQYIREDDEIRVYVPTGTATQPDTCYICKLGGGSTYNWFKCTREYTSHGVFTRQSALTIGELVGNIGAQNWQFGDLLTRSGSNVYLLSDTAGNVVKMDKTLYSLSLGGTSTAQSFIFDTKDLTSRNDLDVLKKDRTYHPTEYMDNESRWLQIKIEAKGEGSMHVQYSIDHGASWVELKESPKTLTATWTMYTFDLDEASPSCMVRVLNSGQNEVVHLRYVKTQLVPGSEVG